ncbi:MAG TPA: hypothetical protein VGM86_23915 [Thermoanaerobaculia bacterium]|jgi:glutathione synthase/RimK-type ligase-like ATP-grasp enzyme
MKKKILIPTVAEDVHALAVAHALRQKGADPILWYTPDFPTRAMESVHFRESGPRIEIQDCASRILETDVDCIWNRRPREELTPAPLDPADKSFARVQCSRFRTALLNILSHRAEANGLLCVNPWESAIRTENKLWQHYVAAQVGLVMPESLYSNDPAAVRGLIERQGTIAYKPFISGIWEDGKASWGCFTNAIDAESLVEDELLQAVPGIYQELIPKAYELRVTMIGDHAFTARLNSQQTQRGHEDWRRAYEDLRIEPWEIPNDLHRQCIELMRRLDIVFGCLDFIVTPDGRYVFLEVNQAGQFLFIEEACGLPLLDAFSELLLQGRPDFAWEESATSVRFVDVEEPVRAALIEEAERHVPSSVPVIDETRSRQGPGAVQSESAR